MNSTRRRTLTSSTSTINHVILADPPSHAPCGDAHSWNGLLQHVTSAITNNNKWRWCMWIVAAYRRTHSPSWLGWLGLKVGGHLELILHSTIKWTGWTLALFWLCHADSEINILVIIIIIIIIIIMRCVAVWCLLVSFARLYRGMNRSLRSESISACDCIFSIQWYRCCSSSGSPSE